MTTATIIAIIVPIAILIINILYQNSRDSKNKYDSKIKELTERKLDIDEYNKDMRSVNARLKKNEDVTSILIDLKEGQAQINTNVEWLKDGFNNLHCKQNK